VWGNLAGTRKKKRKRRVTDVSRGTCTWKVKGAGGFENFQGRGEDKEGLRGLPGGGTENRKALSHTRTKKKKSSRIFGAEIARRWTSERHGGHGEVAKVRGESERRRGKS